MNKNILICLNKLDIGGIETAVVNQVYEMLEKKYNVIVVAKSGVYTEKIKEKGAICIDFCFEIEDGYNLEKSKKIEEIIKKYEIGQVHIHQFDCITSVFPACVNTNTKYISYIHTGVEGTYDWFEKHYKSYKVIFNMYYNMANKIIAITFNMLLGIFNINPLIKGFITYIKRHPNNPNGTSVSKHILPFILNLLSL